MSVPDGSSGTLVAREKNNNVNQFLADQEFETGLNSRSNIHHLQYSPLASLEAADSPSV